MSNNAKSFIEDAVKGCWKNEKSQCYRCGLRRREAKGLMLACINDKGTPYKSHLFRRPYNRIEVILLDPSAWQACGKTRGWKEERKTTHELFNGECGRCGKYANENLECGIPVKAVWNYNMHRFLDLLIDGKSIEDALAEIK